MDAQRNNKGGFANNLWVQMGALAIVAIIVIALAAKYFVVTCQEAASVGGLLARCHRQRQFQLSQLSLDTKTVFNLPFVFELIGGRFCHFQNSSQVHT